jgi:sulfide dehydrogenase [flavocytochrome c] flavoprotein subunit
MTRRSRQPLLGGAVAGLGALGAGSLGGCAASVEGDLAPRSRRRVVVVGGGWGGATAAQPGRLGDPRIQVLLLAPNRRFMPTIPGATPADLAAYASRFRGSATESP